MEQTYSPLSSIDSVTHTAKISNDFETVAETSFTPTLIELGPYPDPYITKTPWNTLAFIFIDRETKRQICVKEADEISNLPLSPAVSIWQHPDHHTEIWAPEIHFENGQKIIHYAADNGDNTIYKSFVATGSAYGPLDEFDSYSKIEMPGDTFAIDATRVTIAGQSYLAWSGWPGNENIVQNIYLALINEDGSLSERHVISTPTHEWEKAGCEPFVREGINEGPQFFKQNADAPDEGHLWRIDAAAGSWTDHYCIAMSLYIGKDPLLKSSWQKYEFPVFSSTDEIFAPGHACVIQDKNETWWLIYHRAKEKGSGWDRVAYAQSFEWGADGVPRFGKPLSPAKLGRSALEHTTS